MQPSVEQVSRNVFAMRDLFWFASHKIRILRFHMLIEIILKLMHPFGSADDLFRTQSVILSDRHEDQMHVRGLLIHVDDSGDNVLTSVSHSSP